MIHAIDGLENITCCKGEEHARRCTLLTFEADGVWHFGEAKGEGEVQNWIAFAQAALGSGVFGGIPGLTWIFGMVQDRERNEYITKKGMMYT